MQRIARVGRLKPEAVDEYTKLHQEMSAELLSIHSQAGLKNFSIYRHGLELFSYLECDDWDQALDYLSKNPLAQAWSQKMKTLLDEPLPWKILDEVWRLD
ncbi:MAG: L-rhamnose mutarotase [Chloroflexota bacterium]|nr:MAG: L-rhamnose mutarotase [Chloroflexota bacterium]